MCVLINAEWRPTPPQTHDVRDVSGRGGNRSGDAGGSSTRVDGSKGRRPQGVHPEAASTLSRSYRASCRRHSCFRCSRPSCGCSTRAARGRSSPGPARSRRAEHRRVDRLPAHAGVDQPVTASSSGASSAAPTTVAARDIDGVLRCQLYRLAQPRHHAGALRRQPHRPRTCSACAASSGTSARWISSRPPRRRGVDSRRAGDPRRAAADDPKLLYWFERRTLSP